MPQKNNSIIEIQDIKAVLRIFSKNWYILISLIIISLIVSQLYLRKVTSIYSAETEILLKADNFNQQDLISATQSGGGMMSPSYFGNSQTFIENNNELRIYQSYDLIQKAVEKMNLGVSYFVVGRFTSKEMYEPPFRIKVESVNSDLYENTMDFKILNINQYQITYTDKDNKEEKFIGTFNQSSDNSDMKLFVTKSIQINRNTINLFTQSDHDYSIQIHNLQNLIYEYKGALTVSILEYSNILQVNLTDNIPQRATAFLDTLSKVYIDNALKTDLQINANTLYYIDKQMSELNGIMDSVETELANYKEKNNILDIDKEEDTYFDKLSTIDDSKSSLQLQLAAYEALDKYIIENKDPEFLPPIAASITTDPFLVTDVTTLYSMQIERNASLTGNTEISQDINDLDKKIKLLKSNLLIYVGNSRNATIAQIADVDKQISDYIGSIKNIPEKENGLLKIQRYVDVNEKMYEFLLQERAATIISKASIVPDKDIIEMPRSLGIISPQKGKITYMFIGVGVILSLIIVFIRTVFFEKIESIDELKEKTSLPILGEILFDSGIKEILVTVENNPKSPVIESFRTIRTNLQYLDTEGDSKIILITSNVPGEGKTFCSVNLASILAKSERKVLLLELDLHKPRVHKALNLSSDIGISTIAIGKNTVQECILKSSVENLDVLLSGPLPPNASELILSKRMKEIIEYGKANYDYVIIDTPPVGLISDALALMKYADVNLYVINTKSAYRDSVTNANEIVTNNKIPNLGLILNGVKRKKSKYYYNRYAYGYGYGYGYGGNYGYGDKK